MSAAQQAQITKLLAALAFVTDTGEKITPDAPVGLVRDQAAYMLSVARSALTNYLNGMTGRSDCGVVSADTRNRLLAGVALAAGDQEREAKPEAGGEDFSQEDFAAFCEMVRRLAQQGIVKIPKAVKEVSRG